MISAAVLVVPPRYLAATYGCRVTGIDLSQPFVDVAQMLTERAGLSSRVTFRRADALELPFAAASFDYAWMQHVAMNIADRDRLYGNIHRVLKPGGRLAIYDVVAGNGQPLLFPVPWARRPENSFLLTPDETRRALGKAGFTEVSWADQTAVGVAWLVEQQAPRPSGPTPPPLGIQVVMGPELSAMIANLGRNFREGKTGLVQGVVKRG